MAYTITSDIARMIVEGNREVFTKNFDPFPIEYTQFSTPKKATKETEYYDSVGNLASGGLKPEGDNISYKKISEAYQTSIKNKTWANGFAHSMESIKYDLYGVINSAKATELARTMRELEEHRLIKRYDEAFSVNLADGVPLCSNSKPLKGVAGSFNDTLATASDLKVPENHKTMINQFANFKNHAGGRFKSYPNKGFTNVQNMMDIEEIYGSDKKANEQSNTKNVLSGKISWCYSTYLASLTAWFMMDTKFEHVLFQTFMGTEFDADQDKINNKNFYVNAVAMYETGALPNIGIVGNEGV